MLWRNRKMTAESATRYVAEAGGQPWRVRGNRAQLVRAAAFNEWLSLDYVAGRHGPLTPLPTWTDETASEWLRRRLTF